jgi:hypothetical protein
MVGKSPDGIVSAAAAIENAPNHDVFALRER